MKSKISVSMMCADLLHINKLVKFFEEKNIDYLHIDVMDGNFVPNFGIGIDYMNSLREITSIPFDIHLMVDSPENKLSWFNIKENDIVTIHYESTKQVQYAFDKLKKIKCKRFLAISPATPIYAIEEVFNNLDGINLLMVNPGFAGQVMVATAIEKAKKLKKFIDENVDDIENFGFEVDGNITFEKAKLLKDMGANIFVAGTSSIFSGKIDNIEDNINKLLQSIG